MVTGDWDMLEDGQQGTDSGRPSEAEKVPAILLCAVPLSQDCGCVAPAQPGMPRSGVYVTPSPPHPADVFTLLWMS